MAGFRYKHIKVNSAEEFVARSVEILENAVAGAINKKRGCVLGLSGGQTPQPVYEAFGRRKINWRNVTVVLLDERYAPADGGNSNQRLVRETLLKNAPAGEIVFPDTSLTIEECVSDYENRLPPRVDVAVLGMGSDGHIASLFPGDADALTEENRRVLHTTTELFPVRDRVTVTMPVLRDADMSLFLLKGDEKKHKFGEIISADVDVIRYPAHGALLSGKTNWVAWW